MRLKYEFETMKLDDWLVAVPVGDGAISFQGVIKLSETAADIFCLLKKETDINGVVSALAEKYSAPRDVLIADVNRFVDDLTEKGLLENGYD